MKSVVNDALRQALSSRDQPTLYVVSPHESRLQPGIDPGRLNQLADELEDEAMAGGWPG